MDRRLVRYLDIPLILLTLALISFGLVAVYSATQGMGVGGNPLYFVKRQAMWCLVGVLAMGFLASVDYRTFGKWNRILYFGTLLVLMAVVLLDGYEFVKERWIQIGSFQFQPSEVAKIVLILTLARHLQNKNDLHTWRGLISPLLHVSIPALLIVMQPDLGTGMVLVAITFGMLFFAGARPKHLVVLMITGILLFVLVAVASVNDWLPKPILKDYQVSRLTIFLDPYSDPTDDGWNIIQSMVAIGSGNFFGKGLFEGTQTQLNYVPERQTDFIFSVIGEELGFLGGITLLTLFCLFLWRCLTVLSAAKDRFGALIVAGIVSMIFFHVVVNIGMTIGLMPITGIPLPFISYGGTSLLLNMACVGLVLNVWMRRKKIQF